MSAETQRALSDQDARDVIATELGTTLMVEAAAGTGKTTSLVTRVLALLRNGQCDVSHLAAITFTVKAAAQLRERTQEALERELRKATGEERMRLEAAVHELDRAFIGTTHAFCARLLRERPIEAGLDPEFEEIEPLDAALLTSEFWQRWYHARAALGDERIRAAREVGLTAELLASTFVGLVEYHGDVEIVSEKCERPDLEAVVGEVLRFLERIEPELAQVVKQGKSDFESMMRSLQRIRNTRNLDDPLKQVEFLEAGAHASRKATLKNWPDGPRAKSYYKEYSAIAAQHVKPAVRKWREYLHCIAMDILRPALAEFAAERRRSAKVSFNDLLVLGRDLLRDHPQVRRYFQRRFTHVLVDEFQDTDPLQAEVLFYLTGEETEERNWLKLSPRAGSLFIVGDPKQSIYRFRRADISTYLAVRERIEATGGRIVALSTNFRSSRAICDFVNTSFSTLFDAASVAEKRQAPHVDLAHHHEGGSIDGVYVLETPQGTNNELAEREAECVARWIRRAVDSKMRIQDGGAEREVHWSDFLLVSRGKARLRYYAAALEKEEIPYKVTGAERFRESQWLRAALPLLRAVVDPSDPVSVASFIRGPFCGAADDELYEFIASGGKWSPFSARPENTAESVSDGFDILREAIDLARELPPAAAIARTFERIGILAYAAAAEHPGTAAGNILLALAIVREESAQGASFAAVVDRLARVLEENVEIEEMDVDPSRDNAVGLMNLHQVKGLEASVVFLIEPSDRRDYEPERHIDRTGSGSRGYFAIRKAKNAWSKTDVALPRDWDRHAAREKEFEQAEEQRLLYVAATRARNILVIGAVRKASEIAGRWKDLAGSVTRSLFGHDREGERSLALQQEGESFGEAVTAIRERREAAHQESYSVVPVTRIAHDTHQKLVRAEEGLGKGTSWGRVLHRLFEAMLREPSIDVRFYAESLLRDEERDAAEIEEVIATVDALRRSPLWQRVLAAEEKYAEVPFAVNVPARSVGLDRDGDTLLHGTIDLVFREGEQWHIVDYKSDSTVGEGRLESLVAYYQPQVEHYARFWGELTGAPTVAGLFFVDGCVERWV
jgi:ATP-dependent helicase/nuclease subunit A